jgi:uncharacterized SAM-binding protein YcdF (DUF218 family)
MLDLGRILDHLTRPSSLVLLLLLVGFCCTLVRRSARFGRWLMALGTAIVVLAALPLGNWPMNVLEDRFPEPVALPDHVDGIIVLGGAINLAISAERGQPSLSGGVDRMTEFLALARYYPTARLVFTGGTAASDGMREADVARELYGGLGLDLDRMIFERYSRNTRENALFSRQIIRPRPGEIWLLVTSAVDMPRAVGCFRAVGWPVTPWPVGYRTIRSTYWLWPNPASGLANLDWATHEWIGLAYYRFRGWTDALFPAPDREPSAT